MRRFWRLLSVCVFLVAAPVWTDEVAADEAAPPVVAVGNGKIEPKEVHIPVGGTVVFRNVDAESKRHYVAGDGGKFFSPEMRKDEEWVGHFDKPGRYGFTLLKHPLARGFVVVGGAPPADGQ